MSFFDTEHFIAEVEKEECLWKTNSKEYMVDRNAKSKAWANVASTMFDEWPSYNKTEQEHKIDELKKKWKHLRDNYARDVNETRKSQSASGTKSIKRYAFSDILSFLQPFVKKRKTTGSNILPHNDAPACSDVTSIATDECFREESSNILDESTDIDNVKPSLQQREKKEKITKFQKDLLDLMKNPPPPQNPEEIDPDKCFLLSFLPDFKKMNDKQKLELKMQFMQCVKNILDPPSH